MRKIKVITDSCADLTGALMEQYDIDYARMSTILEGVETVAELTWSDEEVHALYDTIRGGKRITTAQVSVEEFHRVFEKYLEQDMDIVYIACSSKLSGSVNTGVVVANQLMEQYHGAKISCIDSLNGSIGEGILALKAADMVADGKSLDEIMRHITAIRKNVVQFGTVHTLEHLKRAGRVSATKAFFGDLMGVKPILVCDAIGCEAAFKKVKGRMNSLRELVALMKAEIVDPEDQTIYLAHADCAKEEVTFLADLVRREIPCKGVCVLYIGPIVGSSVGPDTIGLWAFGKTVTFVGG